MKVPAAESTTVNPSTLERIVQLVNDLKAKATAIAAKELELATLEGEHRKLKEETLPGMMAELGITALKLNTGETLVIVPEVYASIPKDSKPKAFAWLEANNFGGLIKSEVKVSYGRDNLNAAKDLVTELASRELTATLDEDVHPQTLKAFLREQLRKGANVPLELFGARPVNEARLK